MESAHFTSFLFFLVKEPEWLTVSQQFFPKPIHSSIYSVQGFRDCRFKAVKLLKVTSAVHLLGCPLLACKPCACQASRPKKEPGVSNRDINALTDEGSLHVWNNILEQHPTPHRVQKIVGRVWLWSCYQGQREVTNYRGMSGWLICYQGSQQRSIHFITPLTNYQIEWRWLWSKIRTVTS